MGDECVVVMVVVEAVRVADGRLVLQPSSGRYSGSERTEEREIKVSE